MQIETPDTTTIENQTQLVIKGINELQVVTHDDYMEAGERLKLVKRAQKQVVTLFEESKSLANRAHKAITEAEKKLLDPLKKAEVICSQKVTMYLTEMKRAQQIEIDRRQKEADAQAKIEADIQRKKNDDERLRAAEQLEAQGFKEEAEIVLSQEIPVAPPTPVFIQPIIQPEKVEGVHVRTTYKAEVIDLMLLVQEIAAGRQPITLVEANESVLNRMATALKNELRIPGVRVLEHSIAVTRDKGTI